MGNAARENAGLSTAKAPSGIVLIPGATFHLGSDRHYPEEAPVHRVTVDGFWMDRTPVTNRALGKFIEASGYVTFAEIKPDPKDYPPELARRLAFIFNQAAREKKADGA
jgi:sulfatase modifying factor 1